MHLPRGRSDFCPFAFYNIRLLFLVSFQIDRTTCKYSCPPLSPRTPQPPSNDNPVLHPSPFAFAVQSHTTAPSHAQMFPFFAASAAPPLFPSLASAPAAQPLFAAHNGTLSGENRPSPLPPNHHRSHTVHFQSPSPPHSSTPSNNPVCIPHHSLLQCNHIQRHRRMLKCFRFLQLLQPHLCSPHSRTIGLALPILLVHLPQQHTAARFPILLLLFPFLPVATLICLMQPNLYYFHRWGHFQVKTAPPLPPFLPQSPSLALCTVQLRHPRTPHPPETRQYPSQLFCLGIASSPITSSNFNFQAPASAVDRDLSRKPPTEDDCSRALNFANSSFQSPRPSDTYTFGAGTKPQEEMNDGGGAAPGVADLSFSSEAASEWNNGTGLGIKRMKAASKASQFYTTIVVSVCCRNREFGKYMSCHLRGCTVFRKVECALRDRSAFPLPADVSLKELYEYSYFRGENADQEFQKYCGKPECPLPEDMAAIGDRLYQNKFTDVKKHITNHVQPKFLSLVEKITGQGTKSGYNKTTSETLATANKQLHEVRSCRRRVMPTFTLTRISDPFP